MASLITKFSVTKDEWVLVASDKKALAVQKSGTPSVEIVVLTAGSTAPVGVDGSIDAYVLYDDFKSVAFENDEPFDAYARARDVASQIRVLTGNANKSAATIMSLGRAKVEPLGTWTAAQTATAGSTTSSITLAAGTRRVSITARNADLYFKIGTGSVAATVGAGSGFLGVGATKDFSVPAGSKIACIRAASTDAILEVDELGEPS